MITNWVSVPEKLEAVALKFRSYLLESEYLNDE